MVVLESEWGMVGIERNEVDILKEEVDSLETGEKGVVIVVEGKEVGLVVSEVDLGNVGFIGDEEGLEGEVEEVEAERGRKRWRYVLGYMGALYLLSTSTCFALAPFRFAVQPSIGAMRNHEDRIRRRV